jgi:hypothetical protein
MSRKNSGFRALPVRFGNPLTYWIRRPVELRSTVQAEAHTHLCKQFSDLNRWHFQKKLMFPEE